MPAGPSSAVSTLPTQRPRLLIELDGAAFHSDHDRFQRDRTRQNRLVALGYTVLRFTYWDVLAGSDFVVDTLDRFLPPNWEAQGRI